MIITPPKKSGLNIGNYAIYKYSGHGVQESPYKELETVKILLDVDSLTAFVVSEAFNIDLYGSFHKLTSWESPKYSYKKIKI